MQKGALSNLQSPRGFRRSWYLRFHLAFEPTKNSLICNGHASGFDSFSAKCEFRVHEGETSGKRKGDLECYFHRVLAQALLGGTRNHNGLASIWNLTLSNCMNYCCSIVLLFLLVED